ncbi:uncharacterized protein LOC131880426 [Tigriopus californicus]|uniref:uncharacterized protein LOC131880426 n=1 Tax=Tigriopus californicus TaxID=6832 RepID=UPI0027DA5E76|nr:uncharacterized protein LOC131880426 [Tigriopus californicus]XP_059083051.1 uncharacterized protein LOC131880426 [Tigriopus californicus]XP_059083052.1 uncharacterized protein LOC131880426 [Tigriopus californicus]
MSSRDASTTPTQQRFMKRSNSSTSISSTLSGYGSSELSKWKNLGFTLKNFTKSTLPRMHSMEERSLSANSSLSSSGARSVARALHIANAQSRQLLQKGKPATKLQAKTTGGLISSVETEIEYWHEATASWTKEAFLKINKYQGKVTINSEFEKVRLEVGSTLRIEYINPITRDFNIILGCNGDKYRIAVYNEYEGDNLISSLSKLGATVIQRRKLPPCGAKLGLRPISEGQALSSPDPPYSPGSPNMHLENGRNPILRRKSTGSTSERRSYNRLNSPSTAAMTSVEHSSLEDEVLLPRSHSMCVKDPEAPVIFPSMGDSQTKNPEKLETFSRRLNHRLEDRKNVQSRSDQSLNSDEISHENSSCTSRSSCNYSVSSSGTGSETEEGFDDFQPAEEIGHCVSDGLKSNPEYISGSLPRKVSFPGDKGKMEKYEFLLVNIEDDPNILDPGQFGVSGEMQSCHFDDYPEDTFSLVDEVDFVSDLSSSRWIRRSIEDLDLEFASTPHERKNSHKRGVQKSQSPTYFHMPSSVDEQSTLSLSMGNLTTVIEDNLCESHSGIETPATTKSTTKNHESHYYGAKGAHQSAVRHEVINFLNDRPGIEV